MKKISLGSNIYREGCGLMFSSTFDSPNFYSISSHVDSENCDDQQHRECPPQFSTPKAEISPGK